MSLTFSLCVPPTPCSSVLFTRTLAHEKGGDEIQEDGGGQDKYTGTDNRGLEEMHRGTEKKYRRGERGGNAQGGMS